MSPLFMILLVAPPASLETQKTQSYFVFAGYNLATLAHKQN